MSEYKEIELDYMIEHLEDIMDEYSKGSDVIYKFSHEGKGFLLTPFDGPYTGTVKENEDGLYVEIPERLLAKVGIKEGDEIDMEIEGDRVILKKL